MKILFDNPIYKNKYDIAKIARSENENWYCSTFDYFKNKEYGFAIKALEIQLLNKPKTLEEMKNTTYVHLKTINFLVMMSKMNILKEIII